VLWVSENKESFEKVTEVFLQDATSEDTEAIFLDIDLDGDQDLYVGSGGKSFSKFSFNLHDIIYINDGAGNYIKQKNILFKKPMSTGAVTALDIDQDGDLDLFVAERYQVETYGLNGNGYLLINNGKGIYSEKIASVFQNLGMVTDAKAADLNKDGWEDLIVVGEWMGVKVFINNKGTFEDQSEAYSLGETQGMWSSLAVLDINSDGQLDLIIGNVGNNSFYKPNMKLFVKDFDSNGSLEQIITLEEKKEDYPILDKDELIKQIPSLKKKFLYYKDYAAASYRDVFGEAGYQGVEIKKLKITASSIFWGTKTGFKRASLPSEIQYSNVSSILCEDVNKDGATDIILGGNQTKVKPQFGPMESSQGWLLINKKKGIFERPLSLGIQGEIRSIKSIKKENYSIIIGINNDSIQFKSIQ
jgi:hypothetical protein